MYMENNLPHQQEETKPIEEHYHLRTIILIVFLGILASGLVIASVYQARPIKQATQIITPTPTPNFAFTTLSLSQTANNILNQKQININISTDKNSVTAVQMELGFDPKIFSNVTITQGTFFTTPISLLKHVDQVNGRISYALGIQPTQNGVQGNGVVAKITYSLLPLATGLTPKFYFLPKTLVTAENQTKSVLKSTSDLMVTP